MIRNNMYEIDGVKFRLKDPNELTLLQDEKVTEFSKKIYASGSSVLSVECSSEEFVGLLKMITVPETKLPEGFNYYNVTRKVRTLIVADFFLNSVLSAVDMLSSLEDLTREQIKQ